MRPNSRYRRTLAAALAVACAAASLGPMAGAEEMSDLRGDIPTGAELREGLAEIAEERTQLVGTLARLEGELEAAVAARAELGEAGQRLAAEIEIMSRHVTELAVRAFVGGAPAGNTHYLLDVTSAAELSWRQQLVRDTVKSTDDWVDQLVELRSQADAGVIEALERSEEIRLEILAIEQRLVELEGRDRQAKAELLVADAWDRAEIAIAEGPYGFAPSDKWEALRFCESTHNYQAISPSGLYRGAYQFDYATWETVGGSGDPAAASPEEQDARARELYARRGDQPWPICGRHLR